MEQLGMIRLGSVEQVQRIRRFGHPRQALLHQSQTLFRHAIDVVAQHHRSAIDAKDGRRDLGVPERARFVDREHVAVSATKSLRFMNPVVARVSMVVRWEVQ